MEKNGKFSKILVIVGTVLVGIPILAPIVFGFVSLAMDGIYRFDYLMPAEFGILAFVGGTLLLWGTLRTKSRQGIVIWGLGIAAGSIFTLMLFGDGTPGSLSWAFVIGLLITYSLAIVVIGMGGILL